MKFAAGIITLVIFLLCFKSNEEMISQMNRPTIASVASEIVFIEASIRDTIPNKRLKIWIDENGNPIKYARSIATGVCIDGECRPVKLDLFWNITGSYLGFELPEGEFFSKTEHDPFKTSDYERLHHLLNNSQSPLANYTIDELIKPADTTNQQVDGVSSATLEDVLAHIVEGAVYTTYTLWHIAHGPTKRVVEERTTEMMNPGLALKLLNEGNLNDRIWTLNHIPANMEITVPLREKLLTLISGSDVYVAERALNALKAESMTDTMQVELSRLFARSGFLQKRLILQKLKEVPVLNENTMQALMPELQNMNGALVKIMFGLLQSHDIQSGQVISTVAELLNHKNRYISSQAYDFLTSCNTLDNRTMRRLQKYEKTTKQ